MWSLAVGVTLCDVTCGRAGRPTTSSTEEAKPEIADEQNRNRDKHDDLEGVVAITAEETRRQRRVACCVIHRHCLQSAQALRSMRRICRTPSGGGVGPPPPRTR